MTWNLGESMYFCNMPLLQYPPFAWMNIYHDEWRVEHAIDSNSQYHTLHYDVRYTSDSRLPLLFLRPSAAVTPGSQPISQHFLPIDIPRRHFRKQRAAREHQGRLFDGEGLVVAVP